MRNKDSATEARGTEQAHGKQSLILQLGGDKRVSKLPKSLKAPLVPPRDKAFPPQTALLCRKCQLGAARVLFAFTFSITWYQLFQY